MPCVFRDVHDLCITAAFARDEPVTQELAALRPAAEFFKHRTRFGNQRPRSLRPESQAVCARSPACCGPVRLRCRYGACRLPPVLGHGRYLGKGLPVGIDMVAERAADVPRAGTFPDKADKIEVVLLADVIGPDRKTPLGHGKADVETAVRVARTADELGIAPQVLDGKHAAADRAFPEVHLLCGPVADIVADHLLVCLELVEGFMQHLAGLPDHVFPGPLALLDLLHVRFDRLGHVRPGDGVGVLFERFGDHSSHEGRAEGIAFHVLAGDEFCDHFVPGTLCTKAEFLHPLDQLALGVAGGRLRLFLVKGDLLHREVFSHGKRGQDHFLCLAERVDRMPARFEQLATGCRVLFPAGNKEDL